MHKRKANFQQTHSCKRCNEAGRAEHAKSHDDEFCGFAGGNYENDFAGAKKAAKASKRAWKRRQSSQELVKKANSTGNSAFFTEDAKTGTWNATNLPEIFGKVKMQDGELRKQQEQIENLERRTGLLIANFDKEKKARTDLRWQVREQSRKLHEAEQLLDQMGEDLNWWSDWYNYRDKDYDGWFRANYGWPTRECYDDNNCVGLMTMKDWKKKLAEEKEAKGYY